jgi:(S)-ureidoglycine aminohydrolase
MKFFGTTRSRYRRSHALIAPDSFVVSDLPGWNNCQVIILIAPRMGAHFSQYIALMEPGATAVQPPPGIERVVYVLEGELTLFMPGSPEQRLAPGGFAFCAADGNVTLRAMAACRVNVFEKRYVPRDGGAMPESFSGEEGNVDAAPFMGDPDASLKVLLPRDARFDMAVNVFTFQPGTALPLVEVHVMEHGLLMLEGQGVYRLGDDWYPVQKGDVIWMAPFCPQWFVAVGKVPATYIYYKDVNRDPMEMTA